MQTNVYLFKTDQVQLLQQYLSDSKLQKVFSEVARTIKHEQRSVNVFLEKNEVENLLDELTFLLTEKGLREDDEPNQFGLAIEDIIGIVNPYK